jgi:hypothetical protein
VGALLRQMREGVFREVELSVGVEREEQTARVLRLAGN